MESPPYSHELTFLHLPTNLLSLIHARTYTPPLTSSLHPPIRLLPPPTHPEALLESEKACACKRMQDTTHEPRYEQKNFIQNNWTTKQNPYKTKL